MSTSADRPAATTFWLVERGQPEGQNPSSYWLGGRWDNFAGEWTYDVNEAAKFGSRAEAESSFAASNPADTPGRAVEHGWFS